MEAAKATAQAEASKKAAAPPLPAQPPMPVGPFSAETASSAVDNGCTGAFLTFEYAESRARAIEDCQVGLPSSALFVL